MSGASGMESGNRAVTSGNPSVTEARPLRILMLHPFLDGVGITPSIGGKSVVAYQLTRQLLETGHTVAILPWKEKLGQDCLFAIGDYGKAQVFATRPHAASFSGWTRILRHLPLLAGMGLRRAEENARALMGLERAIDRFRPDLIHVHYTRSSFATLYPALRKRPPALLTHYHGEGNDLSSYASIAFPSEMQGKEAEGKGRPTGKSSAVIYPPVNPLYLQPRAVPRKERRDEIVFVGRLEDDRKGLDLLLQALGAAPGLAGLRLNVVGDGRMREAYEADAARLSLNVRFLGNVPTEDIVALMRACRVLVTPSRWESFGVVYAESICCGTPVVGYAPMVREFGRSLGLPVGVPFDAAQGHLNLAACLAEALEEGRFGDAECEAIREAACRTFRMDAYGESYVALYRRILGGSAPSRPADGESRGAAAPAAGARA